MMTQLEMRYYNAVINMSKEMSVTREKKVYDLYKIYIESLNPYCSGIWSRRQM